MRNHNDNRRRPRIVLFLSVLFLISATAVAHPMGNFSVNHYSKITIGQQSIEIRYLIDMAEIPTFQEIRQFDITPKVDDPSASRYLDRQEQLLKAGISLESDGQSVLLDTISRRVTFADGAGGLPTMKIGFVFRGELYVPAGAHKLSYFDNNFPGRAGWKEVVVLGDGVTLLSSSAPGTDRSLELTNYSGDVLNSPPQQISALVVFRTSLSEPERSAAAAVTATSSNRTTPPGTNAAHQASAPMPTRPPSRQRQRQSSGAITSGATTSSDLSDPQSSPSGIAASTVALLPLARAQNTPRSRFTELISTQGKLSFWVLLSAALIAAGLGALHALEPGHGKTIVAAYLVGSRGTSRHAVLLGIVVTAAHTAGVYLLGAVTLYASRYIVPEQLYPWLGAISGLSVAALGIFIFLRHWTGETGEHSHAPGEQHSHWFLSIFKQTATNRDTPTEPANPTAISAESKPVERTLSLRELCTLGITGGIVPCPAALVVLLSAFSLHRIGFGLFLITAFSFGLAAVLVIVGLTMVYANSVMSSRVQPGNTALRYLPFLSSAFMVVLGVGITASAVASAQIWRGLLSHGFLHQIFLNKDKLVPFVTVTLLGLFLGMRHSTDPDHVVAVSTIVSRQRSIKSSAAIGLLWGLGHTLTIFLVGSAIIIFGVVIPPLLGLSMEFCVAVMLILLGVLNLTGVIGWITERLTPTKRVIAMSQPAVSADRISVNPGNTNRRASGRIELFLERTIGKLGLYQTIRPLVVGLVHGLAGSAAVALLVLSTIKSPLWSTAYLLVFGFGTMVGMMLMTAAISIPLVYTGKKFFKINRHLTAISGFASIAFGIFLAYHIGFVDGLFTSRVHWTPQ
jgi:nickel/cobalt transporter (NicO) family protein